MEAENIFYRLQVFNLVFLESCIFKFKIEAGRDSAQRSFDWTGRKGQLKPEANFLSPDLYRLSKPLWKRWQMFRDSNEREEWDRDHGCTGSWGTQILNGTKNYCKKCQLGEVPVGGQGPVGGQKFNPWTDDFFPIL